VHRFFIPPEWIEQDAVAIRGRQVHQIRDVLRLGEGDIFVVLDNSGAEYEIELVRLTRSQVEGLVRRKTLAATEPRAQITLYQALLKGDKFEVVLQKGTELGIVGFVPVLCERCVPLGRAGDRKLGRWQRIITEAAEQSRRGKLPFLKPVLTLEQACRSATGHSLLAWEGEAALGIRRALRRLKKEETPSLNLFIGPEGGFSPSEVALVRSHGVQSVSLGRRVLRAETAGLVAATAILYEYGDLDLAD